MNPIRTIAARKAATDGINRFMEANALHVRAFSNDVFEKIFAERSKWLNKGDAEELEAKEGIARERFFQSVKERGTFSRKFIGKSLEYFVRTGWRPEKISFHDLLRQLASRYGSGEKAVGEWGKALAEEGGKHVERALQESLPYIEPRAELHQASKEAVAEAFDKHLKQLLSDEAGKAVEAMENKTWEERLLYEARKTVGKRK